MRSTIVSSIFSVTNCFPGLNITEPYTVYESVPQKIVYQNFDLRHSSAVVKARRMVLRSQWLTLFSRLLSGDLFRSYPRGIFGFHGFFILLMPNDLFCSDTI